MKDTTHISLLGLSFCYGKVQVFKDVNLELERNKIHCVFGSNGSGKTTLLKAISGQNEPNSGRVLVNNMDIQRMNLSQRARQMASVFTSRPEISNMTVSDFIEYGRYPYTNWLGIKSENDNKVLKNTLIKCKIESLLHRPIVELSDGEVQKVQIARALAQETGLLLLDEPVAHLDIVNRAEIFNLLSEINKKEQKTILFTSHDIQFALQLADHFILIKDKTAVKFTAKEFIEQKIYSEVFESQYFKYDADSGSIRYQANV